MNNKVSVLVPALNVKDYIGLCVDSVLDQTMQDIKVLCIDAGSEDGTREILAEYENKDERVRVIDSDKKSYGYQINLGIRESESEYFAIVEADDRMLPRMIEKLVRAANEHRADYVKADFLYHKVEDGKDHFAYANTLPPAYSGLYGKVINPSAHPELQSECSYIWNGIYRRSCIVDNNIRLNETAGAAFQDIGFYHQLMCRTKRGFYIRDPLYSYRLGRDGASTSNKNGLIYAKQEYEKLFVQEGLSDKEKWFHGNQINRKLGLFSLIFEADKLLRWNDYDPDVLISGNAGAAMQWFKDHLQRQAGISAFLLSDYNEAEWERVSTLLQDIPEYAAKLKEQDAVNRDRILPFKELPGERIIFGCGNYGRNLYNWLFHNDVFIDCFTDNNDRLWGNEIEHTVVISPEECIKNHPDASFIIASKNGAAAIRRQLDCLGVGGERIREFIP